MRAKSRRIVICCICYEETTLSSQCRRPMKDLAIWRKLTNSLGRKVFNAILGRQRCIKLRNPLSWRTQRSFSQPQSTDYIIHFIDSQAAIKAISVSLFKSKLISCCREEIRVLGMLSLTVVCKTRKKRMNMQEKYLY